MTTKTCPVCGGEVKPPRTKLCSEECRRKRCIQMTILAQRQKSGAVEIALMEPRVCPTCGTTFQPNAPRHVFCSSRCRYIPRQTGKKVGRPRKIKQEIAG